jgi:hypothetical protein
MGTSGVISTANFIAGRSESVTSPSKSYDTCPKCGGRKRYGRTQCIVCRLARPTVVQPLDPAIRVIALTEGQVCTVDASDYDWLMQWNWQASKGINRCSYYAVRSIWKKGAMRMHRQIMGFEFNDKLPIIDHINRDSLDNRRSNLRLSTDALNRLNCGLRSTNTSGIKGVSFNKAKRKWQAQITILGKWRRLGYFQKIEDAAAAYEKAEREFWESQADLIMGQVYRGAM